MTKEKLMPMFFIVTILCLIWIGYELHCANLLQKIAISSIQDLNVTVTNEKETKYINGFPKETTTPLQVEIVNPYIQTRN